MSFLYPQFLFALIALAIPVIIHLFNFRRYKKILFTNVRFLTDIQKESKSKNSFRNLLLLLIRLLVLACIIIAFAQPYLPHKKSMVSPGKNFVAIYIDNSFSMSNMAAQGDLLQLAKNKAEEAAKAYREGDAFQLLTNDFELKHRRWLNRAEFMQVLHEVGVSPVSRKISEVGQHIKEGFRSAETNNQFSYLFTDFQQNAADLDKMPKDSGIVYHAVPLKASVQSNVYIDSAWFENSVWQVNQNNTVIAKVVNASEKNIEEGTLTLTINGKQKAIANFNILANGQQEVKVNFTISEEGPNKAQLQINDYPITFDDTWYFSFPVAKYVPVLAINGMKFTPSVERAFKAEEAFKFTQIAEGGIDYSALNDNKFIVLNEVGKMNSGLASALQGYLEQGGNVFLVPSANEGELSVYTQFLNATGVGGYSSTSLAANSVGDIDLKNPFWGNIFDELPKNINLPEAKKYYKIDMPSGSRGIVLLRFSNGDPFLTVSPVGKGFLFVSAVPLEEDWGNFASHALFLPSLYKMAVYHSTTEKTSYAIGKDNYIKVQANASSDKEHIFKLKRNNFEVIPPQRSLEGNLNLYVEGLIKEAGFYELDLQSKLGDKEVYAFNYDRDESAMKFLSEDEIKKMGAPLNMKILDVTHASLTTEIKQVRQGSGLWKWFVILALLFILAETALIRFYKQ